MLDKHLENWCIWIFSAEWYVEVIALAIFLGIIGWAIFRWKNGNFLKKPKKNG